MKVNTEGLDNIIFDLGGVILDLNFQASISAFSKLGLATQIFKNKLDFTDPIFYKFQNGEVSGDQFRNWVRCKIGNPNLLYKKIDDAWCKMLVNIPSKRVEKIKELRQSKRVFLFSNTNEIHIPYLENWFMREYGFSFASMFDGVAYSYKIKDSKPSESSFQKVVEIFQVLPNRTLFIDDIEENTTGARTVGLNTLWLSPGMDISEIF